MDEDARAEQMAEDISEALRPIWGWVDPNKVDLASFERAVEDTEILLMKLLDKYYDGGFKDGVVMEEALR